MAVVLFTSGDHIIAFFCETSCALYYFQVHFVLIWTQNTYLARAWKLWFLYYKAEEHIAQKRVLNEIDVVRGCASNSSGTTSCTSSNAKETTANKEDNEMEEALIEVKEKDFEEENLEVENSDPSERSSSTAHAEHANARKSTKYSVSSSMCSNDLERKVSVTKGEKVIRNAHFETSSGNVVKQTVASQESVTGSACTRTQASHESMNTTCSLSKLKFDSSTIDLGNVSGSTNPELKHASGRNIVHDDTIERNGARRDINRTALADTSCEVVNLSNENTDNFYPSERKSLWFSDRRHWVREGHMTKWITIVSAIEFVPMLIQYLSLRDIGAFSHACSTDFAIYYVSGVTGTVICQFMILPNNASFSLDIF